MTENVIQDKVLVVKTTLQKWIGYLKYAIMAGLVITIIVLYYHGKSLDKKNQIQAVELMAAKDSAVAYKTKAGEAYFQMKAVEIEQNATKKSLEAAGFNLKDLKQKNIGLNNLVGVLTAKIESYGAGSTAGHDTILVTKTDTVYGKKYNDWNNGNLLLYDLYADKDSLHHKYKYQTGITLFPEKDGKNTKVTATLTDTHAVITTGYSIIITPTSKWYMKPWLWGLAGLAGGIFIAK